MNNNNNKHIIYRIEFNVLIYTYKTLVKDIYLAVFFISRLLLYL